MGALFEPNSVALGETSLSLAWGGVAEASSSWICHALPVITGIGMSSLLRTVVASTFHSELNIHFAVGCGVVPMI